jgi:hypothetical protein
MCSSPLRRTGSNARSNARWPARPLAATATRVPRPRPRLPRRPPTCLPPSPWIEEFWVPHRSELVRVAATDIDRIDAERDYVRLHVGQRSYLMLHTIQRLEDRLDPARFIRLHRSTIVRRDRIQGLRHDGLGSGPPNWPTARCCGSDGPIWPRPRPWRGGNSPAPTYPRVRCGGRGLAEAPDAGLIPASGLPLPAHPGQRGDPARIEGVEPAGHLRPARSGPIGAQRLQHPFEQAQASARGRPGGTVSRPLSPSVPGCHWRAIAPCAIHSSAASASARWAALAASPRGRASRPPRPAPAARAHARTGNRGWTDRGHHHPRRLATAARSARRQPSSGRASGRRIAGHRGPGRMPARPAPCAAVEPHAIVSA